MIYSFDVFDTCLVRLCGSPTNAFEVLSHKVAALMPVDENDREYLRQQFVTLRVGQRGKLEDAYDEIAKVFPLPASVEEMVSLELQTERELMRPVLSVRDKIDALREKGKIVFISDMYLPDAFIKEMLVEHGFFHEGDALFVSDSVNAWKYDGTLYPYVRDALGASYKGWHHYGDNYESDYAIPKKLGIKSHWLHFDYLAYEQHWMDDVITTGCQYPSIIAGVSRTVRLSAGATEGQKKFVADISAPLMTFWVLEMLRDAQRRHISRIYFCARDMHSYYLVARCLQGLFPDVEVRYLFVSRKSLYDDSDERIAYLVQEGLASGDRCAVADAVSTGTTYHTLNKLLTACGYPPLAKFYCLDSLWKSELFLEWDQELIRKDDASASYCIYERYLGAVGKTKTLHLLGFRVLYEILFSLNYHSKTVGYRRAGDRIRPVFGNDEEDSWTFRTHRVRTMKKENDLLLTAFAEGVAATGLCRYSSQILERIALTTLAEFFNRPDKNYLDYLHDFQYWDVNYVDKRWKKNVWKRGSTAFSFPSWMTDLIVYLCKKK